MSGKFRIVVSLRNRRNSKNLYFDLYIPTDIWNRRDELLGMGFDLPRNQQRSISTGTEIYSDAKKVALDKLAIASSQFELWRTALLNQEAQILDEGQASQIASEIFSVFFQNNLKNPRAIRTPKFLFDNVSKNYQTKKVFRACMKDQEAWLFAARLVDMDLVSCRRELAFAQANSNSKHVVALSKILLQSLNKGDDIRNKLETRSILQERGLAASRHNVDILERELSEFRNLSLLELEERAFLKKRILPNWVEGVGTADHSSSQPPIKSSGPDLELLSLLDHKFSDHKNPKTVRAYRTWIKRFTEFSGKTNASEIAKSHVRDWRDSLKPRYLPKTINGKALAALSVTLEHGVREFDLEANVAKGLRDDRKLTEHITKGYSDEQARQILRATRTPPQSNLKLCYKDAIRWVPWIAAYTGLRVTEITKLFAEDFKFDGKHNYIEICQIRGRTKNDRDWITGIHPALIDEGLQKFVQSVGTGPMFYPPYPSGIDLKNIEKHRAEDAGKRVAKWVRDIVGIKDKNLQPNHAWRHRFSTEYRKTGGSETILEYIHGSRPTSNKKAGYGEFPVEAIVHSVNKLPSLEL